MILLNYSIDSKITGVLAIRKVSSSTGMIWVRSKVVADVAVTPVLGKSGDPPKSPSHLGDFPGSPQMRGGLGGILFHQRVLTTPG